MEWHIVRNDKKQRDKLEHAGVDGMHWYVRKYQYKDGSLTPEGKKHYAELREKNAASNNAPTTKKSNLPRSRQQNITSNEVADVKKRGNGLNNNDKPLIVLPSIGNLLSTLTGISKKDEKKDEANSDLIPTAEEYDKAKEELDDLDYLKAWDFGLKSDVYVKKEEFRNYVEKLVEQGIDPELSMVATSSSKDSDRQDVKQINTLIKYWNEQVDKVQNNAQNGTRTRQITPTQNATWTSSKGEKRSNVQSALAKIDQEKIKAAAKKLGDAKKKVSKPKVVWK